MSDEAQAQIQEVIDNNTVVLFMKGSPSMPQCGFSARTVEALNSLGVPYETVDVLSDPNIRQGIKDFSNWPTIPQLYVNKEFIGGCDTTIEMYKSGVRRAALLTPPHMCTHRQTVARTASYHNHRHVRGVCCLAGAARDADGGGCGREGGLTH